MTTQDQFERNVGQQEEAMKFFASKQNCTSWYDKMVPFCFFLSSCDLRSSRSFFARLGWIPRQDTHMLNNTCAPMNVCKSKTMLHNIWVLCHSGSQIEEAWSMMRETLQSIDWPCLPPQYKSITETEHWKSLGIQPNLASTLQDPGSHELKKQKKNGTILSYQFVQFCFDAKKFHHLSCCPTFCSNWSWVVIFVVLSFDFFDLIDFPLIIAIFPLIIATIPLIVVNHSVN